MTAFFSSPWPRRRVLKRAASFMALGLTSGIACAARPRRSPTPPDSIGSVVIVGAGMAGLGAAQTLQQAGVTVTVVEGRDRVGGRIHTSQDLAVPIDLGASWIHGTQGNPLTDLVADYGITTASTDYDAMVLRGSDGEVAAATVAAGYRQYGELQRAVKAAGADLAQDTSVQWAVDRWWADHDLPPELAGAVRWWLESETTLEFGLDRTDLSLWEWDEDEALPGGDVLFPAGFSQLPLALAADLDIHLGQRVTTIAYGSRGVTLTTATGQTYQADGAVVTVPVGVLQRGDLRFDPPLPEEVQTAIAALRMGVLNKVGLTFPQQFWPDTTILGYLDRANTTLAYGVNLAAYHDTPALMLLSGGANARRQEALSDEALGADILAQLRSHYGPGVPEPTGLVRTRWSQDPFAYGSYSNLPVGSTVAARHTLARPIAPNLLLAGEAMADYPATVHGAYLSGLQAAATLLAG